MKQARTMYGGTAIGMIAMAFLVFGCNSNSEKKETTDTTTNTSDTTTKVTTATTHVFKTIFISADTLNRLFTSGRPPTEVSMIYFQYQHVGPGANDRNYDQMQAYGADEYGQDLNNPLNLREVPTGPTLSFDPTQPYSQQITIGNMRGYLGMGAGTGSIPRGEFEDVWLVPCIMKDENGKELIYYRITSPGGGTADCPENREPNQPGRISTNPSPPAKPCADPPGDCGGIEFLKKFTKDSLIMNAAKSPKTH